MDVANELDRTAAGVPALTAVRGGLYVSEAAGSDADADTSDSAMSTVMLGSLSAAARSRLDRGPRRLTWRLYVQAVPPSVQRVHVVPSMPG